MDIGNVISHVHAGPLPRTAVIPLPDHTLPSVLAATSRRQFAAAMVAPAPVLASTEDDLVRDLLTAPARREAAAALLAAEADQVHHVREGVRHA